MTTDETLLKWYMRGFNDELKGVATNKPKSILEKKAYTLGATHAIIGDDVRSVDYLSQNEILSRIKNT